MLDYTRSSRNEGPVAPINEDKSVQEIWESSGRPDVMAHKQSVKIAGILKGDNQPLVDLLGEDYTPIPWEECNRNEDYFLPDDIEFSFLGKDISSPIKKSWGRGMHKRFKRALGVYDWVLKNQPKAIVVWTDEYPECRAAVMAGNDLRIPTIEVIHGAFHPYYPGNFSVKSVSKWKLGSWEYRRWHNFHAREGQVVPTGITFMDNWVRANMSTGRSITRHKLRIPDHVPTICFIEDAAFNRGPWNEDAYVVHVRETFLRNFKILTSIIPDVHLIVKLHPYDHDMTPQNMKDILKKHDIKFNYSIIDDGLAVALAASDLAVGLRSTAMVFGLIVGLPSMPIEFRPYFEDWAYRGFGFEPVTEVGDVLSAMTKVLTDNEKMQQLIRETARGAKWFGTDGMATIRAARAIKMIVDGKEPDEECHCTVPE